MRFILVFLTLFLFKLHAGQESLILSQLYSTVDQSTSKQHTIPLAQLQDAVESLIQQGDLYQFNTHYSAWRDQVLSKISPDNVGSQTYYLLMNLWVRAMKQALSSREQISPQVQHISSSEEAYKKYSDHVRAHPSHIALATGQSEDFMIYDLVARSVFQRFHPYEVSDEVLQETCFLRYPTANAPKNLEEHFRRFPVKKNYDQSPIVSAYLISVSPSLDEMDRKESAMGRFQSRDQNPSYEAYILDIFREEGVPRAIYQQKIKALLAKRPCTDCGGILTQIFLPRSSILDQHLYLSEPMGKPINRPLHDFFESYARGEHGLEIPQLRLLSSGLNQSGIKMLRYTYLTPDSIKKYESEIHRVIDEIVAANQREQLRIGKSLVKMTSSNRER